MASQEVIHLSSPARYATADYAVALLEDIEMLEHLPDSDLERNLDPLDQHIQIAAATLIGTLADPASSPEDIFNAQVEFSLPVLDKFSSDKGLRELYKDRNFARPPWFIYAQSELIKFAGEDILKQSLLPGTVFFGGNAKIQRQFSRYVTGSDQN